MFSSPLAAAYGRKAPAGQRIIGSVAPGVACTKSQSDPRSATPDPSATLTQLTDRLDQVEHEYGARLDKLSERVDQDSSSRFADIAARLDKLEKKVALAATPPASESADVVARLDKLEKKVALAATPPASESADVEAR